MTRFEYDMPDAPEGLPIQPPKQPDALPASVSQPVVPNETLKHPPQWTATEHYDPAARSRYQKEYDEEAGAIHLVDPQVDKEAPNYRVASLYPEIRGGADAPGDQPGDTTQNSDQMAEERERNKREWDAAVQSSQSYTPRPLTQEEIDDMLRGSPPTYSESSRPLDPPTPPTVPITPRETSNDEPEPDPRVTAAEARAQAAETAAQEARTAADEAARALRDIEARFGNILTQIQQDQQRLNDLNNGLNRETQAREEAERNLRTETEARRAQEERINEIEEENRRLREEQRRGRNRRPPATPIHHRREDSSNSSVVTPEDRQRGEVEVQQILTIYGQAPRLVSSLEDTNRSQLVDSKYAGPEANQQGINLRSLMSQANQVTQGEPKDQIRTSLEKLVQQKELEVNSRVNLHEAYVAVINGDMPKWKESFDKISPEGFATLFNTPGVASVLGLIEEGDGQLFTLPPADADRERQRLKASLNLNTAQRDTAVLVAERLMRVTGTSEIYHTPKLRNGEFVDIPLSETENWLNLLNSNEIDYQSVFEGNGENAFTEIFYLPIILEAEEWGTATQLRRYGFTYAQDMIGYLTVGNGDSLSEVLESIQHVEPERLVSWSADIVRAREYQEKFEKFIEDPIPHADRVGKFVDKRDKEGKLDYAKYRETIKTSLTPLLEVVEQLPKPIKKKRGDLIVREVIDWSNSEEGVKTLFHLEEGEESFVKAFFAARNRWDRIAAETAFTILAEVLEIMDKAQVVEADDQNESKLNGGLRNVFRGSGRGVSDRAGDIGKEVADILKGIKF